MRSLKEKEGQMNYEWDILGEAGFQFFGKMSASISHEIKNALAIMNENAGLLEDYASMGEKGISVDLKRLRSLAGNVRNQIQRADEIVMNMNRFAHSVDRAENAIEVGELLALMTTLAHRFATMRGVTLEFKPPQKLVTITANQFFLEHLIWLCLEFAMDKAGEDKIVELILEKEGNAVRIIFTGLIGLQPPAMDSFQTDATKALLEAIGAKVSADGGKGELVVTLSGHEKPLGL
jgi:C4-dicarboxylate-specific signal transduction histidine kinase